jgi:chromosome partitioning protein
MTMKTIVFAASKGGVGKTTLALNIAVEAAKYGKTFIADADPQKSLERFCELRSGNNPLLLEDVASVSQAVADLKLANGYAPDFLVADSPGSMMEIITDAVSAADCIVLPMQPSAVDILAQEDVLQIVGKMGKLKQTLCVLNRVDGRVGIDDIAERVMTLFPNPHVRITNRAAYQRALAQGLAGPEIEKDCAPDIAALWKAIKGIIGVSHGKGKREDGPAEVGARPG